MSVFFFHPSFIFNCRVCMKDVLEEQSGLGGRVADSALTVCVLPARSSPHQEDQRRKRADGDRQPGAEPRESGLAVPA